MNKDKTLWTDPAKKFKPRNKQAALICIRAKDIHRPPPEPTVNALIAREQERIAIQERARIAAESLAAHEREIKERKKLSKIAPKVEKKERIAKGELRNAWVLRAARMEAKNQKLDPPTKEELQALRERPMPLVVFRRLNQKPS